MIRELLSAAPRKVYAGVGSRETPADVLALMTRIADRLGKIGFRLRSGGADGADSAFEQGAPNGTYDLFLPWPRFNGRIGAARQRPSTEAFAQAMQTHPGWWRLSDPMKALHARNVHQVLGAELDAPASFLLCWTPDGATTKTTSRTGGTGQAIRIAVAFSVPVFNLQRDDHRAAWTAWAEGT